ncbi:hypothetical protein DKK76_07925 [Frischella perrara]|uniref:Nucleoid-associated protein n=1 Tax=Frischella perrara TaxID=1267021 RepID=A0A318N1R8_FRIPE|nr:nucleoid-associated protein [Frischella perrara]PXY94914.1 hypothetical protein DKK76_07925 [Frischella perrara]
MSFTLRHAIIHELLKEQYMDIDDKKKYNLRTKELDCNSPIVIKLSQELIQKYGKKYSIVTYGSFDTDKIRRGKFPDAFQKYHSLKRKTKQAFIDLSVLVMNELATKASEIKSSSGGYILFLDYSYNKNSYLVIAMIKQKDALTITDNLNLEELLSIDLSKIHQATRINCTHYSQTLASKNDDDLYLSFVSSATDGNTSGYFITALGCQKNTTASKMTKNLIKSSVAFFKNDTEIKKYANDFKDELIKYLTYCCEEKQMATLEQVISKARHILERLGFQKSNQKADELLERLNSDSINISAAFNVNKNALNSIVKVKLENDDYTINFTRKLLGTTEAHKIFFDEKKGKYGKLIFDLDEITNKNLKEILKNL